MSDKIFDKEVCDYLLKFGVTNKQINDLKFSNLKQLTIDRLKIIAKLLEEEKFEDVQNHLAYSPAGDGMGDDNYYIFFYDLVDGINDLNDVCNYLKELKKNK
ncbi:MAG: hypothetical protein AMQ22_00692 [Candidatus Methanofastidiosum methylothiophilum]|uniref:Uncharacterized protein n=1 Tax=Candidatus Methanofastidiosum methylothiophilum TaxID=1705564 RepID=A0A150J5Y2_9EURY|nr:MAG: hypothetical protein AMQ22_00692 [Candidatus Methanofastidiosum methylthiophilus]